MLGGVVGFLQSYAYAYICLCSCTTTLNATVFVCVCVCAFVCVCSRLFVCVQMSVSREAKLSCMWFAGNDIGDEGAKQLAKILEDNTALTSLGLEGTRWCSTTPAFVYIFIPPVTPPAVLTLTFSLTRTSHPITRRASARTHIHTHANYSNGCLCAHVYVFPSVCRVGNNVTLAFDVFARAERARATKATTLDLHGWFLSEYVCLTFEIEYACVFVSA